MQMILLSMLSLNKNFQLFLNIKKKHLFPNHLKAKQLANYNKKRHEWLFARLLHHFPFSKTHRADFRDL